MSAKVAKKIIQVMKEVGYLQKDGKIAYGSTRYTYLSEEKITAAVREAMINAGLAIIPVKMELIAEKEITTKGGTSRIMNISVTYHVIDADSGEFLEVQTLGEGMDNGDKTAYKAMTGAFKYAQRQAFMIPTGDDPDQVSSDELSNTSLQQKPVSSQESRQKETGSTNGHVCEECQNPITQKVASYSKKNMGRSLCMPCQKKHKVASGE